MDLGSLEAPAATMNAHNCYIHITRKKDVDMWAFYVIDHSFGKYSSKSETNLTITYVGVDQAQLPSIKEVGYKLLSMNVITDHMEWET